MLQLEDFGNMSVDRHQFRKFRRPVRHWTNTDEILSKQKKRKLRNTLVSVHYEKKCLHTGMDYGSQSALLIYNTKLNIVSI